MKYAILKLTLTVFLCLSVIGCSHRMIDFTVISSKNTQLRIDPQTKGPRTEGVDSAWSVLFIPGRPDLKEAVDRAIEGAGTEYDALVDGVVYYQMMWFVFATKTGYKVQGTPINTSVLQADLQKGEGSSLASRSILYHSSKGISNDEALKKVKFINVNN